VRDQLPPDARDACGRKIVRAARVYLARLWVQIRGPKNKPNPIEELRNLKEAADALLRAIKSLSGSAQDRLATKYRLRVPDAPDIMRLRCTLDAFLHEHRYLRNLDEEEKKEKPIERRGRKVNTLEREFQVVLDSIYKAAFAGGKPHRGFPAFEKAVIEPLKAWDRTVPLQQKSRQDRRRPPDRSTRHRRIKQDKSSI